jgi:hypothetical protein
VNSDRVFNIDEAWRKRQEHDEGERDEMMHEVEMQRRNENHDLPMYNLQSGSA